MDIFELLTKEAINRYYISVFVLIALSIVVAIFVVKYTKSDTQMTYETHRSGLFLIAASIMLALLSIISLRASSTFVQAYSDVATIKNWHTVEVVVDGKPVSIDLNHDKSDPIRRLTDALSQTTGQHGFNKIKEVKQISASRYEIVYQRKCGKISSYVSDED